MPEPTETAVVVLVPEAEPVVAPYRLQLDRAAAWGVPAHVTVLYPFVDPARLDDAVLDDAKLDDAVLDDAVLDDAVLDDAVLDDAVLDDAVLDDAVLERLGDAVRTVPGFEARFTEVAWFGDEVAWLAPDPVAAIAFRALTAAAYDAFPDHPPYGGAHDDVVPHLTLGESAVGGLEAVRAAADAVAPRLPIRTRVREVAVLAGAPVAGSWTVVRRIALPAGRG